ncbi:hypothetical protein F4809DRAFT_649626 [Biscogniauxia mediterranea]|nr:hypothetical protein F4809DRAFT_649626 [Biscogniauxia mediterranea]
MPHKEETREFTPELYPDFPEGFPTVELQTISLAKLLSGDAVEQERVFRECKGRGFFYLELAGCAPGEVIARDSHAMALLGEEFFKQPIDEKMKYSWSGNSLLGYKHAGATVTDRAGTRDKGEFFNIGKNDMLGPVDQMSRSWPEHVVAARPVLQAYMKAAHGIGMEILGILAKKLGVDPEEIQRRHRIMELSDDHVRVTRGPPRETEEMPEIQTPSHTDFGTVTILTNWLGGLQVWSESARTVAADSGLPDVPGEWLWVKPKKGCAIINLGDAAVKYTNGVLCSGRHRVIPSPGAQGKWTRYSVVYFVRPENKSTMEQLRGEGIPDGPVEENPPTASEWIAKRAYGLGARIPPKTPEAA